MTQSPTISRDDQNSIADSYKTLLGRRDAMLAGFEQRMNAAHWRELIVDSVISGMVEHFHGVSAAPARFDFMSEGALDNPEARREYFSRTVANIADLFERLDSSMASDAPADPESRYRAAGK